VNLAVAVGDTDIIHINQGDFADTRTGQRFCRPGADTTNTNHADVRRLQARKTRSTI